MHRDSVQACSRSATTETQPLPCQCHYHWLLPWDSRLWRSLATALPPTCSAGQVKRFACLWKFTFRGRLWCHFYHLTLILWAATAVLLLRLSNSSLKHSIFFLHRRAHQTPVNVPPHWPRSHLVQNHETTDETWDIWVRTSHTFISDTNSCSYAPVVLIKFTFSGWSPLRERQDVCYHQLTWGNWGVWLRSSLAPGPWIFWVSPYITSAPHLR